jgi:hypothetical protein
MRTDHEFLDQMRRRGDRDSDIVVANVFQAGSAKQLYSYLSLTRDEVAQNGGCPEVQAFLLRNTALPEWFDEDRFVNGQKFFRKYALDIMTLVGAMSLHYCYAASPGNKAIYLTEKMRKTPGKRLLETAHFIIEVMKEGVFAEGGSGYFEVQKTRLIHALVRHYILHKTEWNSTWGVPVNQEDMAGTNLAFSYIIVEGMQQSDFVFNGNEADDFLYAWKFVGFQLGIDEALLPSTIPDAKSLERVIRRRHFHKSAEGPLLVSELIKHYRESFPAVAGYFVDSQIRYFIGPEVSSLLGLQRQPLKDSFVRMVNALRKKVNRKFVNPFSYQIMMRNHMKLKEKYAADS